LGLDEGSMGWGHGVFHGSYIDIKDNHKKNPYHNDKQIEINPTSSFPTKKQPK
jgi:hypothetical protein